MTARPRSPKLRCPLTAVGKVIGGPRGAGNEDQGKVLALVSPTVSEGGTSQPGIVSLDHRFHSS